MCGFMRCIFVVAVIFEMILASVHSERGSCPPAIPVDVCDAQCGPDIRCRYPELCCPTDCGGSLCVDPVTTRHLVDFVKPGRCPEHPRGPWVCTSTCTTDSDCRRSLKCCANRCGAFLCQRPELDEIPTLPPLPPRQPDFGNTIPNLMV